jgi:hypothetical protein
MHKRNKPRQTRRLHNGRGFRSPGAQPGNSSALTHGLYSQKRFQLPQLSDEDRKNLGSKGLCDEIASLRLVIQRVLELANDNADLDEAIRLLDVHSKAAWRLANLLKMQKELGTTREDWDASLQQALDELHVEWGLNEKSWS